MSTNDFKLVPYFKKKTKYKKNFNTASIGAAVSQPRTALIITTNIATRPHQYSLRLWEILLRKLKSKNKHKTKTNKERSKKTKNASCFY